jgi:hypothetical protein
MTPLMGFCEAASSGLGAGGLVMEAMARIQREKYCMTVKYKTRFSRDL